jgi:hypothetical protein
MPIKKNQQKKLNIKPKSKKLKGGLISQDSDDTGEDLIKESDDDIEDHTSEENETEDYEDEVSKNSLDDDEDEDKLDKNHDVDDEAESVEEDDEIDDKDLNDVNDKCAYKSIIKKRHDDDSDAEIFDEDIGEKDSFKYKIKKFYIDKDEYISKNILTKYERVRVLSVRTANLSAGAKPMIKNIKTLTYREIAKMELKNKKMPFIIERQFSDGSTEVWDVNELEVIN